MKTEHTQGPWTEHPMTMAPIAVIDKENGETWVNQTICIGSGERRIADIIMCTAKGGWSSVDNIKEANANARLICAAPKMYEALQQISQMSDGGDYFQDIMKMKSIASDALNQTKEGEK